MVNLLGLDQLVDPVFLPAFQRLDKLSLVQQMLLVLGEILSTHILDLRKLHVVLLLHIFAVRLIFVLNASDAVADELDLFLELLVVLFS